MENYIKFLFFYGVPKEKENSSWKPRIHSV